MKEQIRLWKEYRKHINKFNEPLIKLALDQEWTPVLQGILKEPSYAGFMDWIIEEQVYEKKKVCKISTRKGNNKHSI